MKGNKEHLVGSCVMAGHEEGNPCKPKKMISQEEPIMVGHGNVGGRKVVILIQVSTNCYKSRARRYCPTPTVS
jgi:hypothetical protein